MTNKADLKNTSLEERRNFFNLDITMFNQVLNINTIGTVVACRAFGRQMAKNEGGSIINFASMNTYCPLTRVPAYAMSKAAIARAFL